jgi:flavin-dependent dehydrogenase
MLAQTQDYDVLILGGGPSGLSTALHLKRDYPELAARLLILERAHYPRPKLCAGGLVLDAEVILQRLGLDVGEIPHVDASEIHFDFEGRGLGMQMPQGRALRVVRRDEFDEWLARKTRERGIHIQEGVTVKNVRPELTSVTVETNAGVFRGRVIVGADGSNGVTRRCILPNAPVSTARVLEILTPEPAARQDQGPLETDRAAFRKGEHEHKRGAAYFDFFPVPAGIAGYTWDFPTQVKGEPMRCWGVYDTNLLAHKDRPALKQPLAEEMARHGFDLRQYELKGHPIRWFDPVQPLSTPRVLLVGDAAGADPVFGEGISMALGYGALAAREIAEAFRRNDFSFRGYKRRVLCSPLGQTLLTRWFIARVTYRLRWRWFQILLWRIMKPVVAGAGWLFVLNWGKRLR